MALHAPDCFARRRGFHPWPGHRAHDLLPQHLFHLAWKTGAGRGQNRVDTDAVGGTQEPSLKEP